MKTKSFTGTVVEVTQRRINTGQRGEPTLCPLALAVKAATAQRNVSVGYCITFVSKNAMVAEYDYPKRARTFLERFDDGKPVKPFSFKVGKRLR